MNPTLLAAVRSAVESATGIRPRDLTALRAGGGCIHEAFTLRGAQSFFVKVNTAARIAMFEAEGDALRAIAATGSIRVPGVIASGIAGDSSFLVLEHLNLKSGGSAGYHRLGEQLAALHRIRSPDGRFGWERDNFIGSTPQANGWHERWADFWRDRRLEPQLKLAADDGVRFDGAQTVLDGLGRFFRNHRPAPSLLHGDLWSGNASFLEDGTPVVYDPACYFGDRETDLAFTEFFGGFPRSFYEAYDAAFPRDPGWRSRRDLYNLYHALNHFNLFGGGYRSQAQQLIHALVSGQTSDLKDSFS